MDSTVDTGPGRDPQGLVLGSHNHPVTEVLDRWPGAGHLYLKVRTGDGGLYLLRREDATDRWQVWLYQADQSATVEPLSGA